MRSLYQMGLDDAGEGAEESERERRSYASEFIAHTADRVGSEIASRADGYLWRGLKYAGIGAGLGLALYLVVMHQQKKRSDNP